MTGIEVPREQWHDRCDTFSREHHGWLVDVRRVDTARLESDRSSALADGRLLAVEEPLHKVEASGKVDAVELSVTVGRGADETTFRVEDVIRLIRERANDAHRGLRIDSGDGTTLLVEFRTPAKPEALDGLAESEL